MKRILLKSKIHRATVTDANINYEGSISIDPDLCLKADLLEFEKVDIYNITNGERFSTYVILGDPGDICLNGAAARKVQAGDEIIIASYAHYDENELQAFKPLILMLDKNNNILKINDVK
jgi:aspartate 1-decarboxylase